jgi:pimeloyl-ACP methyl ester carboxylesterase
MVASPPLPSAPPPPLGLTGVICQTGQLKIAGRGILSYTVYRPRLLTRSTTTTTPITTTTKNRVMMNAGRGIATTSSFLPPPPPIPPPPPLVCVAGGPSGLSSTYLSMLVHGIIDRAVILYDHMGSGQSLFNDVQSQQQPSPLTRGGEGGGRLRRRQRPVSLYHPRLEDAITDLRALLVHLFGSNDNNTNNMTTTTKKFHLLGHSYGGIVAFECVKRYYNHSSGSTSSSVSSAQDDDGGAAAAGAGNDEDANEHSSGAAAATAGTTASAICQSLILANVPHDVAATLARRRQLQQEQSYDDFMSTHECRVVPMPFPLRQSLESRLAIAGGASRHYDSSRRYQSDDDDDDDDDDDIEDNGVVDHGNGCDNDNDDDIYYKTYVVHGAISPSIPTALLFGEHDFVESSSEMVWTAACPHHHVVYLAGCSHYAMIENDTLFNSTVMNFLQDNDG